MTLRTALGLARVEAIASQPFVPEACAALAAALPDAPIEGARLSGDLADDILAVAPGSRFVAPGLLFAKIAPEQIEEWEATFRGAE